MQKYIVLLILTVFFAVVSHYLVQTINPFDMERVEELVVAEEITVVEEFDQVVSELIDRGLVFQLLNVRSLALVGTTLVLSLVSGFMLLHLVVEKLFFRKFYEAPSILTALRRGIFLGGAVISVLVLRIFQAEDYLAILAILLLLVVEIAITKFLKPTGTLPESLPTAESTDNIGE